MTAESLPHWTRSRGLTAGGVVVVVLIAAGLALSRIDLALLALPLLAALAWSAGRPHDDDDAAAELVVAAESGRDDELDFTLSVRAPAPTEAIVVRLTLLGSESRELVVAGPELSRLPGRVPLLHSGPQELVSVDYRLLGADAATTSRALGPLVVSRVVAPPRRPIQRLPLPRRLQGLTGPHASARAGDGGEFRDVHPFAAGDRLRRIDWKATARRGQGIGDLYVRRTDALADATVLIVLDSREDVGEQVAQWSDNLPALKGTSVLDIAREAAACIAEGYIRAGDRVGFQDLSNPHRTVPHAGGGRQLWRLLHSIELSQASGTALRHRRPPAVPAGALVYLLSALLDDQPLGPALRWAGDGHRVIAVDVLPAPRLGQTTREDRVAHRILMMQRRDRIRTLQAGGVEMLRWPAGDAAPDRAARLLALSRPPRAERTRSRR